MNAKKRDKIWNTGIAVTGYLLAIALIYLCGNAVAASRAVAATERYPNLYVAGEQAGFAQPEQKTVYFTFDDGPSRNTEKILNMLQEEGIKATFFVTAQEENKELAVQMLRRIVEEGHTLGLHTYSHKFKEIYQSADTYLADIDKLNTYIVETIGAYPAILRFPGGSATSNATKEVIREIIGEIARRGYLYYDWDVVSGDQTGKILSPEEIARNIVSGVEGKKNAIVLCHDSGAPKTTAEGVRLAIHRLREQGYVFEPITCEVPPKHFRE